MHLKFHIQNILVDAIPLDPLRCKDVNYINAFKRLLRIKHYDELKASHTTGTFYIEVPPAGVFNGGHA